MPAEFTFYDILGISSSATPEEIKAAYHAAVLKYHPDVNSAPNAQRLTAIINEAYATLSDQATRGAYDAAMRSGSAYAEPADEREEIWDLYRCDGCGNVDTHLRYALFFKVWSILVFTQMRGLGGVLCPKCRSRVAISTALFSAFLGPWGFPWGIFYTLRALFASLRGGELPKMQNAQLLRHQGIAFLQRGLVNQARTALNASLWFEKNNAVVELLKNPMFAGATIEPVPGWLPGQSVAAVLFLVPPVVVIIIAALMGSGSGTSTPAATANSTSSATPSPEQSTRQAQLSNVIGACKKVNDMKADYQAAYEACGKAIAWLTDEAKSAQAGSEDQQDDMLMVDLVRERQATAASGLNLQNDADRLDAQTETSLKALMSGGVTDDIRSQATKSYNCYFKFECDYAH